VAPPVFKTGTLSSSAKIAKETLGFLGLRRRSNRPIRANSGHRNVYRAPQLASRIIGRDVHLLVNAGLACCRY
jgi:hypothetical protein